MKIPCTVFNKPAVVVGYSPGRKGRIMCVVITEGKLKAVRLKDIELLPLERDLPQNVEPMAKRNG